jgi:hypothetical protein
MTGYDPARLSALFDSIGVSPELRARAMHEANVYWQTCWAREQPATVTAGAVDLLDDPKTKHAAFSAALHALAGKSNAALIAGTLFREKMAWIDRTAREQGASASSFADIKLQHVAAVDLATTRARARLISRGRPARPLHVTDFVGAMRDIFVATGGTRNKHVRFIIEAAAAVGYPLDADPVKAAKIAKNALRN